MRDNLRSSFGLKTMQTVFYITEQINITEHINGEMLKIVIIIRLQARPHLNSGFTLDFGARSDGVHAFGYNFAESQPIWMKSVAALSKLLGAGSGRFWARSAQ